VEIPLRWCAERDREATLRARERARERAPGGTEPAEVWHITFGPLLRETRFVPLMRDLLNTLEDAYAYPVDVEFTVHLSPDGTPSFSLVQCRPLQTLGLNQRIALPNNVPPQRLFFATDGHFMGGNIDQPITRIIHVDGPRYSALTQTQKFAVARLVGELNRRGADRETSPTLLIGPGRWGTSTPELGVPIRFADISRVAVIAEVAELGDGMVPDLSFGSHFFQDLVESRIAYVALFPHGGSATYNPGWLGAIPRSHRLPLDTDGPLDPSVAAAIAWFDVSALSLRVVADVLSQRLVCYQSRAC
jgi:hypothetical protein